MATKQNWQPMPNNPQQPTVYRGDPNGLFGLPDFAAPERPADLGATKASSESVNSFLSAAARNENIPDWLFSYFDDALNGPNGDPKQLPAVMAEFESYNRSIEQQRAAQVEQERAEQYRVEALGGLEDLSKTYRPQLQQEINRYTGGGTDVSKDFIYRDPTSANAISAVDASIGRATQRAQQNAALASANAGVASSGKNIGVVGAMEVAGAAEGGRARADAFGKAHQDLSTARGNLRGFDTEVNAQKANVNQGFQPAFGSIAQWGQARPQPAFGTVYGTQIDTNLAGQGVRQADTGLGLQALGVGAGLVTGMGQQFQGLMPFGK